MKLAQPAWLILLVLLPLLGTGALLVAATRRKQWAAFVAPRLRGSLFLRGSRLPRWFALGFLLAACAAMILALARPQGDDGTRTEKSIGRNVLVALDLSRSMRVQDVKPDRLTQAKMIIYELLDAMPNERIGLIGFAGTPNLYAPLTVDHRAVRETVEQIDETWPPVGGSDLAAAVHLATATLKKTGQKNNTLVILSDGEKHEGDLEGMIAEAERSGVFILAIGVGTEDGDYVPNPDFPGNRMVDRSGKPVISRLQPDVMRKLAEETKGRYAIAGSGMNIPDMVKSAIKDMDAFEVEGRERRVSIEFFQWLVFPAILFLLISILAGTRWKGINAPLAAAACVLLTAPGLARADGVTEANDALAARNYTRARDAYRQLARESRLADRTARFHLGEGESAYHAEDYKDARTAFSGALLSEDPAVAARAHAGMANTLFQLGWRGLAGQSYPRDSAKLPDLAAFDKLVRDQLEKLKNGPVPLDSKVDEYARFKTLITNWTDAVRHYDSALEVSHGDATAQNNRELTMTYLKRLQELLEEDEEQTRQAMPQPQSGEGPPQQGEGDGDKKKQGDQGDKPPGKNPNGRDKDKDKDGNKGDKDQPPKDKDGQKDDKDKDGKKPDKGDKRPDETPEERARRILKENADLEKGPLVPGRREFLNPEKDW